MNSFELRRRGPLLAAPGAASAGTDSDLAPAVGEPLPLLPQALSILRRRKWFIVGVLAIALLLGLGATLLATPLYTASSTLEIRRDAGNFINVEGVEPEQQTSVDLEFYQTQYGLLRSRSLAERVARRAAARTTIRDFFEMFGVDPMPTDWFENGRPSAAARRRASSASARRATILLDNLESSPVAPVAPGRHQLHQPRSRISRSGSSNAWAQHFIAEQPGAAVRSDLLCAPLPRAAAGRSCARRLDESERRLVGYAARERIINIPATTPARRAQAASAERPLVADDLAALNRELAAATADADARRKPPGGSRRRRRPRRCNNPAISGLRAAPRRARRRICRGC